MARVIFESIAYFAPLDGAAWWASSRISSEPGRKSPSQSRSVAGVGLVDQQPVRHQEPRVRRPRVDPVAPLLPDPGDVFLVEDLEDQAEAVLQLFLPLQQHRGRAGHDDVLDLLAEQQFAGDQPGLDRLAEADVVGDEQVHPRQAQGLAEAAPAGRRQRPVLEPACQVTDGPGDLRIDRVLRAARRGGVVGLVEDQQ